MKKLSSISKIQLKDEKKKLKFNPLNIRIFAKVSFKTWLRFNNLLKEKVAELSLQNQYISKFVQSSDNLKMNEITGKKSSQTLSLYQEAFKILAFDERSSSFSSIDSSSQDSVEN